MSAAWNENPGKYEGIMQWDSWIFRLKVAWEEEEETSVIVE